MGWLLMFGEAIRSDRLWKVQQNRSILLWLKQNKSMFCCKSFITSSYQSCFQCAEDGNTLRFQLSWPKIPNISVWIFHNITYLRPYSFFNVLECPISFNLNPFVSAMSFFNFIGNKFELLSDGLLNRNRLIAFFTICGTLGGCFRRQGEI